MTNLTLKQKQNLKLTQIAFQRRLNEARYPVQVAIGRAWKDIPYGNWLRRHDPEKFKAEYEKWCEKKLAEMSKGKD